MTSISNGESGSSIRTKLNAALGITDILASVTAFGATIVAAANAAASRTVLGISATNTPFTPSGTIAATDVQTAIAELDTEKKAKAYRGALVKLSGSLTGLNVTTATVIPWNTEDYDTDGIHNFSSTVTITVDNPGVITWTAHGLSNGSTIVLSTTDTLPAGLLINTTYYVVSAAANTFSLAATPGGTGIETTDAGAGVHTATNYSILRVPAGVTRIRLSSVIRLDSGTSANFYLAGVNKNGLTSTVGLPRTHNEISGGTTNFISFTSPVLTVTAGDNFEFVLQSEADTSVDLNVVPSCFAMEIVE